ncbi:MAG TPA: flavodoxin family protein [Candidatus Olsenella stercoravium]|uniref:Flavodoxin family protein n=1 Tax=Candidatus Olsenella stercoravium TaxID=2838713 RepID=A0A9D2DKA0_9ACTN|nr:flavodoxin family protein [Candidatus Olsenella stercoravium]
MSYAIICSSKTGNTKKLAQRAREVLGEKNECSTADADLVLLGSWTDKGGLDPALEDALPQLAAKRVFLFGTCGFGGSQAYYDRVLDRFQSALPEGAQVVGRFMCQGQMPPAVRARYVTMAEQDPKRFEPMIENFDRALGHPDAADLTAFEVALRAAL